MLGSALWIGAWLGGHAAADDTIGALARLIPDAPGADVLAGVRATGANRVWLLLPRPGRTLGWPRDVEGVPEPALLLCRGDQPVGLLRAGGPGWRLDPVATCAVAPLAAAALQPREAARSLSRALADGAALLERLDLARADDRPIPHDWRTAVEHLPAGLAPAGVEVLTRAATVLDALDLALASDGAAVTAGEAGARRAALVEVGNAVADVVAGLVGGLAVRPVPWAP